MVKAMRLRARSRNFDFATVGVLCAALLVVGAGGASAAPSEDVVAERVSDAISRVAPPLAEPAIAVENQGAELVGAGAEGTEVVLPSDAEVGDALRITKADGLSVELGLPEGATGDAVIADDGTAVYDDAVAVDVAVQPTEHGARIQTVLLSSDAPIEYTYEVGGLTPSLQDDGSVLLLDAAGQPAGYVAPAWAFDANGVAVATSYSIVGSSVVQTVAHNVAGVSYPVVADPSISLGWRIYVRYSPSETYQQTVGWRGTVNDKAKYAAILCAAIGNWVAAAACGFYVYDASSSIMNTARTAVSRGRGITIEYFYNGMPVSWYVN